MTNTANDPNAAHKFYTEDAAILRILDDLRANGVPDREYSDIVSTDAKGNKYQYVDLVMEGGGVLGVALLGYTYILEQMGIRFLWLAGTSAGAINTMLMAASGTVQEEKSPWVLAQLSKKNLFDFVDGDDDARDFVNSLVEGSGKLKMVLKGLQVMDNFQDDFGLNPGNDFHAWMTQLLNDRGIKTLKDLKARRETLPDGGLRTREGKELGPDRCSRVAIIAADVTTETKVEFPAMSDLYWAEPDKVNPADFVRASMSIPFFFHPFRIGNIPQGKGAWENWKKKAGYVGNLPPEAMFIDGGIMSNFPIDLFHDHAHVPTAPTFGVKLGIDRTEYNKNDQFLTLIGSIFDSARHVHDFDFLYRNPDYSRLITIIDTGGHNWLNFGISDKDKLDLFVRGANAAATFLKIFDWKGYKKVRQDIASVHQHGHVAIAKPC